MDIYHSTAWDLLSTVISFCLYGGILWRLSNTIYSSITRLVMTISDYGTHSSAR